MRRAGARSCATLSPLMADGVILRLRPSSFSSHAMRSSFVRRGFLLTLAVAGCANPRTQTNIAQALNEASTAVSGMQQDITDLQAAVDSLRTVTARQDTIIRKLANLANVPVSP